MFLEGGWTPRPEPGPEPRRPRLTRRQERTILLLVGANMLFLLAAPLGGSSVVRAALALLFGR